MHKFTQWKSWGSIPVILLILIPQILSGNTTILSESPSHIEYRFTAEWRELHQTINGKTVSAWKTAGLSGHGRKNGYLVPLTQVTFNLPPGATPTVEVLEQQIDSRPSAPFAQVTDTEDPPVNKFATFAGHQSIRGWNVGQIWLAPATYVDGEAKLVTSARIRISWNPGSQNGTPRKSVTAFDADLLRGVTGQSAPEYRTKKQALNKIPATIDRSGRWYKIPVTDAGLYRLSYSWLQAQGTDLTQVNRDHIRVFAPPNFGLPLETGRGPTLEDIGPALREIPIRIADQQSGEFFQTGEAIEFFGQPSSRFVAEGDEVEFIRNTYETTNYYWLNIPGPESTVDGLRWDTVTYPTTASPITTVPGYFRHERELHNYHNSGTRWYGETFFGANDSQSFPLDIPSVIPDSTLGMTIPVARGNDQNYHYWDFYLNGHKIDTKFIGHGEYSPSVVTLRTTVPGDSAFLKLTDNQIRITSRGEAASAQGHLDYIELEYTKRLEKPDDESIFRLFTRPRTGTHSYYIKNAVAQGTTILDVTHPEATVAYPAESYQQGIRFSVDFGATRNVREIMIIPGQTRIQPAELDSVPSFEEPRLRRSDIDALYIIITAEAFLEAAQELADFRENFTSPTDHKLPTEITSVQEIYDEFSGGLQDPVAIRNFLAWAYRQWQGIVPVQYVLLFGDGDYDYRNITGNSRMFVPTWQYENTNEAQSKEIDDRFVLVDGTDYRPDIAIGRFTATSISEAMRMVDKTIAYESNPPFGQWRSTITLVGDDLFRPNSYETQHIQDIETDVLPNIPDIFHFRKLYLPDFPIVQDLSSFGVTRPGVTEALLGQLQQGTVIVNFSGHGSPKVWTQERVFTMDRDINRVNTGNKLPFWVAATCEWGRFDLVGDQSMTEALLAMENNGAIGILSAARLSYLTQNIDFMDRFFNALFSISQQRGTTVPVGMASIMAKSGSSNDERYVVFGDPAVRLATPTFSAEITDVNPDTFAALSQVSFNGGVSLGDTSQDRQFQGTGYLSVFDAEIPVHHQYQRISAYDTTYYHLNYPLSGPRVFYGPVSISGGNFSGQFRIPKDISYTGDPGKMSILYQGADSVLTGAGIKSPIIYQGTAEGVSDTTGPSIQLGFTGYDFRSGDAVSRDAAIEVALFDEYGLNLTGSIGHQLKLLIDGPATRDLNVTDFFSYDLDSYQRGTATYPLPDLPAGEYTFTMRAWDTSNNLSIQSVDVTLIKATGFSVSQVYNYPNPMRNATDFTFSLSAPGEVKLTIHTLAGQPVRTLRESYPNAGFHTIHWDGTDHVGAPVANGIYLYRITARSAEENDSAQFVGKLAITR